MNNLLLRLASLLWRLRCATSIETGLLQIQHDIAQDSGPTQGTEANHGRSVTRLVRHGQLAEVWANEGGTSFPAAKETPFFDVRVGS
jgi:hypothetical protein